MLIDHHLGECTDVNNAFSGGSVEPVDAVVIVAHGRPVLHPSTVAAFAEATHRLIVVNATESGDSTAPLPPQWTPIDLETNHGYADAVNHGLDLLDRVDPTLRADLVCILTPDVQLDRRTIDSLSAAMTDGVAIAGPALRDATTGEVSFGGRFPRPGRAVRLRVPPVASGSDGATDVDWVDGCCLMVRRSVLQGERFDASLFLYVEEVDLCARLRSYGRRVVVVPAAEASQISGATVRAGAHGYLIARNHVLICRDRTTSKLAAAGQGLAFAGRELARSMVGSRTFHRRQALGAAYGVLDGLRGRSGQPPTWLRRRTDISG